MLDNCFTTSEWSWNGRNTALCNREEHVNDSLACNKGSIQRKLLHIWTSFTNRPSLHHGKLFVAILGRNYRYNLFHCEISGLNLLHFTGYSVGNHNFLLNYLSLLYRTEYVACFYFVSDLCNRNESPLLISLQGSNLNTTLKVIS